MCSKELLRKICGFPRHSLKSGTEMFARAVWVPLPVFTLLHSAYLQLTFAFHVTAPSCGQHFHRSKWQIAYRYVVRGAAWISRWSCQRYSLHFHAINRSAASSRSRSSSSISTSISHHSWVAYHSAHINSRFLRYFLYSITYLYSWEL